MPLAKGGRMLKRWRWVGVFSPELMLCVGDARIGPLPQRWWAVALPGQPLRGRTTIGAGGVELGPGRVRVRGEIDLTFDEGDAVDVVSPAGARGYIWTRKQGGVAARGTVLGRQVEGRAIVDDSAGYHQRHTGWRWSAGVGLTDQGEGVAWNLVDGIHDAAHESERTVWREDSPAEVGPVRFAPDLTRISFAEGGELAFTEWSAREENRNLLLFRSRYRQPFGTFSGELPGGLRLAEAQGVMEDHDVLW
jgi:hypothetical protein